MGYKDVKFDGTNKRIEFVVDKTNNSLSDDQRRVKQEIMLISRTLRHSFPEVPWRDGYFEELAKIGKEALVDETRTPLDSEHELENVKETLTIKANHVRVGYVKRVASFGVVILITGLVLVLFWAYRELAALQELTRSLMLPANIINGIGAFGFALVGLYIGTVFMTFVRNQTITFESIPQIQYHSLPLFLLFTFLSFILVLFSLLLYFNVIVVGVGSVTLNEMGSKPWLGIFTGLTTSLSESAVVGMLTSSLTANVQRQ